MKGRVGKDMSESNCTRVKMDMRRKNQVDVVVYGDFRMRDTPSWRSIELHRSLSLCRSDKNNEFSERGLEGNGDAAINTQDL